MHLTQYSRVPVRITTVPTWMVLVRYLSSCGMLPSFKEHRTLQNEQTERYDNKDKMKASSSLAHH